MVTKATDRIALRISCGVWVPAFAGTTGCWGSAKHSGTVATGYRRDRFIAGKLSLAHFRQATPHGVALGVTEPIWAEVLVFDIRDRPNKLVLGPFRPTVGGRPLWCT